jgi:hypothetical protein
MSRYRLVRILWNEEWSGTFWRWCFMTAGKRIRMLAFILLSNQIEVLLMVTDCLNFVVVEE